MKSRHRAREAALQILYRYDLSLHSTGTKPPSGTALAEDMVRHFEHFQVIPDLRPFSAELVAGTLMNQESLDEAIEKHAVNWKVSRMAFIDRCLLRMATYEMKNFPDTPPSVVMDEAIELAKQFGTAETPSFVNGILDAIQQEKLA